MPTKTFSELITFTRPDPGTYYDAQGVLRTAAIDEPRLTYDPETGEALGLLIEEERTRLNTIAAAPTDPENVTVTGVAHTISFFGTGTVNLTGVATETLAGTGDDQRVTLTFAPTAGTLTITPTGTVENLQLEAGSFATSVILGEGSQVTRAADNASVDELAGWFNADGFTIYSAYSASRYRVGSQILNLGNGTNAEQITVIYISSTFVRVQYDASGQRVSDDFPHSFTESEEVKIGLSFDKSGLLILAINGEVKGSIDVSSAPNFSPTSLFVLSRGGSNHVSGVSRLLKAEPRALTAPELEALTAL